VVKDYKETSLIKFQENFQTEEDCQKRLFELRWPDGFVCPHCEERDHYKLPKRHLYPCKGCGYQASITAGTVMHGTRTSLVKWFWAIFLMSTDKRGISALALSKKIEVSYWVAWTMLQKIRRGMNNRDSRYQLSGILEIDNAFFGGAKEGGDKQGRGSSKTSVIVEASTSGEGMGYAKMTVGDKVGSNTVREIVKADAKEGQTIRSDGFTSYHVVKEEGYEHRKEIVKGWKAHKVLKWTHILISHAKAFIQGTFHGVDKKHLQAYLDEFCYRFNRRRSENQLFDRLATTYISSARVVFLELTK